MALIFDTQAPYTKIDNQSYWVRIWKAKDNTYTIGAYTGFDPAPNPNCIFAGGFMTSGDAEAAWRNTGVKVEAHMRKLADALIAGKQAVER